MDDLRDGDDSDASRDASSGTFADMGSSGSAESHENPSSGSGSGSKGSIKSKHDPGTKPGGHGAAPASPGLERERSKLLKGGLFANTRLTDSRDASLAKGYVRLSAD